MEDKTKKIVPNVETLTGDMVQVIEESHGGLVKKIIKEQEEHEIEKKNSSPQSKKNKLFMLLSLVFMLLSLALLGFLFSRRNTPINIQTKAEITPIIFTDKVKLLEIGGLEKDKVAEATFQEVNKTEVKRGGVEAIYLTESGKIIGLRRFLELIKGSFVPGELNLVSDSFLMGAANEESKNFFILFKVRSFEDVFNSMRLWESKMFSDLHRFFGIYISSASNYLSTKNFEDGVVENKNARILYDNNNNIILMYIFADEQSLILTSSRAAAHEVMLRLAGSQIEK